jgi:hypothetical protein
MKKNNILKKVVASMMLSILLFGGAITAHAATCYHETYPVYTFTSHTGSTTHQYVKETRHNLDGTITYIYGTCTITGCIDHYNRVCIKCGTVTGTTQSSIYSSHSVAHN